MMKNQAYDIIVVGAGLVGLATAYHLKRKFPEKTLLIVEKEAKVSCHQSGHNSGVIHSGIYYKPRSLKAKNCINGYNAILDFSREYGIPFDICGKVIVATEQKELPALQNIYDRGVKNGLDSLQQLNQEELKEYEPNVNGIAGIYVPQTGIIDYPAVANKLLELIIGQGGEARFNERIINITPDGSKYLVETDKEVYSSEKVVTCAGLQSDRVAKLDQGDDNLRIIPFRGEYYKLKPEKEHLVKNLIYPVPNPEFPFLGVHFTRMIHGGVEAGPNAVLAFKREGYKFKDFDLKDVMDTFSWPGFWKIAFKYGRTGTMEMYRSLSKALFAKSLQKLVPEIQEDDLIDGGAGVRAQACDRKGNLVDDFNFKESENIIHVRNAPSPAATSCLSIGEYISNRIQF